MDWEQQAVARRLRELEEENEHLKGENATLRTQLNRTTKQLSIVQEQLSISEQVTIATQIRELQQEGIYENLIRDNAYEKLRPELKEVHVYTKLPTGSFCHCLLCHDITVTLSMM